METFLIIACIIMAILCFVLLVAKDYYKEELEKAKSEEEYLRNDRRQVIIEEENLKREIELYKDTIAQYKSQLNMLVDKIDQLENPNNLLKECEEIKPIKILKITTSALLNKNAILKELEFFKMQVEKYGYIIETPPYHMEVIEFTPIIEKTDQEGKEIN